MEQIVFETTDQLGKEAAARTARLLGAAIAERGAARLLLATGQSQFAFYSHILEEAIDWSKVEIFHLDEYIGIGEDHKASFVRYIKDRLLRHITPKQAHLVDGKGDIAEVIRRLTAEITREPVDVAMIGIGENSHIAFNDPPADFDTTESYIVVRLEEKCRRQQVGEGWFDSIEEVPDEAVTATVHQIMQSRHIISCVPHREKAQAVKMTLEAAEVTNEIPATILKTHPSCVLLLDRDSASLL